EPPARHKFTSDPRQPLEPVPPCVAEHVDDVCPDVFREHEMIVQLLSPPEAFGTCGRERSEVATVPYGGVTLNDARANSNGVSRRTISARRKRWCPYRAALHLA